MVAEVVADRPPTKLVTNCGLPLGRGSRMSPHIEDPATVLLTWNWKQSAKYRWQWTSAKMRTLSCSPNMARNRYYFARPANK